MTEAIMPRDGHFCVCIKRPLLADLAENRTRPTSYGHIPTYERWKWNGPGTMCSPLRNDSKIKTQWLGILFSNPWGGGGSQCQQHPKAGPAATRKDFRRGHIPLEKKFRIPRGGGVAGTSSSPMEGGTPPENTLGGVIYPLKKNSGIPRGGG